MEFGMPTLVECAGLAECCALCRELGLQFVEINMSFPAYQLEKIGAEYLKALRREYGVYFTIHLDEEMNPFDFNTRIAAAYTQETLEVIELAREVGIPRLNLHLQRGVYVTLPGKRIYLCEVYGQEYLRAVHAYAQVCAKVLQGGGTLICMENTDYGLESFHREALGCLLAEDCFGLTLDVGHAFMGRNRDLPYYDAHADRLRHMHLHNAAEGPHLPLDEGKIDIPAALSRAERTNATVVVEVKTIEGLRRSVDWLKARGRMRTA